MREPVVPALARQDGALREVADRLLQEERVAPGALDQQALEGNERRRRPQERVEETAGVGWPQRVEVHARGAGPTEPRVVVFGTEAGHDERERRQSLHEELERVLGVGVDPLEILE